MRSTLLFLLAVSGPAQASSRFEVIGLSKTHLALRELYSRAECCGADPVIDCRYDGVPELEKRLDPIKPGVKGVQLPKRFGAVRLHVLPWQAQTLVDPLAKDLPGHRVFDVYESVTKKEACTSKQISAARLAEAHAFAREVGIDLKTGIVASTVESDPTLAVEDCRAERYAAKCRPEDASFFVFGSVPDVRVLELFVQVGPAMWQRAELTRNAGVWLSPRREIGFEAGQVTQFRRFIAFMGEVDESPLFLVEPPK